MKYTKYYNFLILISILSFIACEIDNELPVNEIRQAPKISISETSVLEADENNTIDFEVALSWDYTQEVKVNSHRLLR